MSGFSTSSPNVTLGTVATHADCTTPPSLPAPLPFNNSISGKLPNHADHGVMSLSPKCQVSAVPSKGMDLKKTTDLPIGKTGYASMLVD